MNGVCLVCGRSQENRPSIFKNEDYCSDICRKVLIGEVKPEKSPRLHNASE